MVPSRRATYTHSEAGPLEVGVFLEQILRVKGPWCPEEALRPKKGSSEKDTEGSKDKTLCKNPEDQSSRFPVPPS